MKIKQNRVIIIFILFMLMGTFLYYLTVNKKDKGDFDVVVLAYHNFMTKEEKKAYKATDSYTLDVAIFEQHLKYLKEQGYNSIDSEDLNCWMKNTCFLPKKSVLITIDDGNLSSYRYALPLLEKYGFDAINFIITSRINVTTSEWDPSKNIFIGQDIIKDIKDNHSNMELASHSHSLHQKKNDKFMSDIMTYEELVNDLKKTRDIIDTKLFCYPYGHTTEIYREALKEAGFEMAFRFRPNRIVSKNDDFLQIPRVEISANMNINKFIKMIESL